MAGRVAGVLVGIFLGVAADTAAAQSLADVARQEAARRQQGGSTGAAKTKVLTNADLPASAIVVPAGAAAATAAAEGQSSDAVPDATPADATAAAEAPAAAAGEPAAPAAAAPGDAPVDEQAGWRDRAARINASLAAAQSQVRQLRALSDRLSLESQASNPTVAARAQAERGTLRDQIAQAEEKAAEARAMHASLVHEARTAAVPPAWIQ